MYQTLRKVLSIKKRFYYNYYHDYYYYRYGKANVFQLEDFLSSDIAKYDVKNVGFDFSTFDDNLRAIKKKLGKPNFKLKDNLGRSVFLFKEKYFKLKIRTQVMMDKGKVIFVFRKIYGDSNEVTDYFSFLKSKYDFLNNDRKCSFLFNKDLYGFEQKASNQIELFQIRGVLNLQKDYLNRLNSEREIHEKTLMFREKIFNKIA